jgi:hypothetical protein
VCTKKGVNTIDIVVVRLCPRVSHSNSFVSSYIKKKDHFNSECSKSVQSKKKVVANARDLMDDAAKVRSLEYEAAFDSYSNERDAGMIASSVFDPISTETLHIKGFYPKPITSFAKA